MAGPAYALRAPLMCGINGLYAHGAAAPDPDAGELLRTRERMRKRGPDGAGEWWSPDRRVALAHRRLAILDLHDRALQPMPSPDGRLALVFNGEIYNTPELRAELERARVRLRTTSDTELILHLYAREGAAMLRRLRGMFAIGLYDAERRGLLLARDPYGIKPLYYANAGGMLRFASQVKALTAGGGVSRALDPAGVAGFHLFGHVPEPFTLYRGVCALPAGTALWTDAAGARAPARYADLAEAVAEGRRAASPGRRPGDLDAAVRAAVGESVRRHLLADVEVGAFLSAGVDSGALVGLMADAGQGQTPALTLGFAEFEGGPADEVPLARETAARYGARHIVSRVGRDDFLAALPDLLDDMDQPSVDGINTWFVARAAREAGLKVALSGLGGDELLAGYATFRDLPRWRASFGRLARLPFAARLGEAILRRAAPRLVRENPKALGLLRYADSWAGAYLLRRAVLLPFELDGAMDPELAREGLARLQPLARIGEALRPDPGSQVGRIAVLESTNYLRNQLLRDADWAGMAHGVEIRTPLVDFTLLQALSPWLPGLRAGAGKRALALAPSRPLPQAVIDRRKSGFAIPVAAWAFGSGSPDRLDSRRWAARVLEAALA